MGQTTSRQNPFSANKASEKGVKYVIDKNKWETKIFNISFQTSAPLRIGLFSSTNCTQNKS